MLLSSPFQTKHPLLIGHAVLLALDEAPANSGVPWVTIMKGLDGKPGWLTTPKSKMLAYDHAADMLREGKARIRSAETLRQLASIQGANLRAPEGRHDDRAMAFVLALAAIHWGGPATCQPAVITPPVDWIAMWDKYGLCYEGPNDPILLMDLQSGCVNPHGSDWMEH